MQISIEEALKTAQALCPLGDLGKIREETLYQIESKNPHFSALQTALRSSWKKEYLSVKKEKRGVQVPKDFTFDVGCLLLHKG